MQQTELPIGDRGESDPRPLPEATREKVVRGMAQLLLQLVRPHRPDADGEGSDD